MQSECGQFGKGVSVDLWGQVHTRLQWPPFLQGKSSQDHRTLVQSIDVFVESPSLQVWKSTEDNIYIYTLCVEGFSTLCSLFSTLTTELLRTRWPLLDSGPCKDKTLRVFRGESCVHKVDEDPTVADAESIRYSFFFCFGLC